jgi:hypothetical protein
MYAPLGLHVQPEKCTVYSEDVAAAASVAEMLGVRFATNGIMAAGTLVGTPAFEKAHAESSQPHPGLPPEG